MVKYTLNYFDARGLGEPIRLIFKYAGVDFTDNRIPHADWPKHKSKAPTGKLPNLQIDDLVLSESGAIYRSLARKYNLNGANEWEAAYIDSIFETLRDTLTAARPWFVAVRESKPNADELYKKDYVPARDTGFKYLEAALAKSKSGFIADSGVTWADFFFAESLVTIQNMDKEFAKLFPKLVAYQKKVHAVPQIKDYVAKRPASQF
uniref:glutathione transferase n=1 Tax=Panagrellus redivivus TaxID=6233 RepID=A0A7E4VBZ9_PANRE